MIGQEPKSLGLCAKYSSSSFLLLGVALVAVSEAGVLGVSSALPPSPSLSPRRQGRVRAHESWRRGGV